MTESIEDEIQQTEQTIEKVQNQFETLEQKVEQLQEQKISKLAEKVDFESSDIDVDDLKEFLKRPYLVNEAGEDRYEVVVPQFVGFQVGKLDRQVENYNVFVVDKYTKWMTGIPAELQDEIDLDDDPRFTVKGDVLEYDEEDRNTVEEDSDIQDHVSDVTDEKATIKQGHEFELIADLIEKGELPFTPQPVADEDLREPEVNFELRDYQQEGFDRFMDEGHACFCWMTGAGKSFPAIYALDSLRYDEEDAKKAVVVHGKATEQQWKQYFEEFAPRLKDEVEVVTYQSLHKLNGEYNLVVYDECLTGDTVVETKDTGRITFDQLDEELDLSKGWTKDVDMTVKSFDPESGQYTWETVSGIYKTEAPVKKIITNRNKELKATAGHTHLVLDPDTLEVKEQKDVSEGDFLLQPLSEPQIFDEKHPVAELIGWYIGDGHMNEYGDVKFSFGRKAEEQIQIISDLCDEIGVDYSTFENHRGDLTIRIPKLQQELGWTGESGYKVDSIRVPAEAYNWRPEKISALLRGLFDAEGSVDEDGTIQFNSVSENLAEDVDLLLQKIGIECSRQHIPQDNQNHNDQYRLLISPYYGRVFERQIGFKLNHKQERLQKGVSPDTALPVGDLLSQIKTELNLTEDQLAEMAGVQRGSINGAINGDHRLGQEAIQNLGRSLHRYANLDENPEFREKYNIPYSEIGEREDLSLSYAYNEYQEGSAQVLSAVEDAIQERQEFALEIAERIDELRQLNVLEVESIEEMESETVYDFETESHTFLANGFLTHNCHALPADTFAKGATIPTKYRIGLTASPYREDGRENYIFALTGPPVGLDWETTLDMMEKSYHEINVHVVEDRGEKISRIESILDDRRTLVFCDSLDFGEEISDATGLPFVNGEDKNQLEKIQENEQVIISRIGDHGISIDDLEVVLEADFLFGSRRQQLQRTGRLFHGEGKRHDIFFTRGEFNKYQKRLYSLIEKGFTLNFVDEEEQIEIPEKYGSRVDLDLEGEKVESETTTSDASATSRVENMDKIDFLKNDRIQEAIEDAMEGYSRVSNDDMWKTLLAIADSEDGMTHTEISQLFESSKSGSRYTKPFREGDPAILVAEKEEKEKRWSLNVEEFQEIIQAHEKRQEKKERISDLKNEIGLS